jgi:SAM-dependent methyltransferase
MWRAAVFLLLCSAVVTGTLGAQERADPGQAPDVVFVATPMAIVAGMLDLAGVADTDLVYDLGSGDGRIVIAAARRGARAVGIELEPSLVAESRAAADTAGVAARVEFRQADIFDTDMRGATVVTLYLGRMLNERLRPVFLRDLRPGSRVVSQAFDMGDWPPDSVVTLRSRDFAATPVHLWVVPARVAGPWVLTLDGAGDPARRIELSFSQRYQRLEGTAAGAGGTMPLRSVRLRGDSLAFSIGARRFAGRVTGSEASGTVTSAAGAAGRWRATRVRRP